MDKDLKYELNSISEIKNKIYPTHVPEGKKAPFLVYITSNHVPTKTLYSSKKQIECSYLLNVFANRYEDVKVLNKSIEDLLNTFPERTIGVLNTYIEDMTINNITITYEYELKTYRGIIDVDFTYKEE